MEKLRVEAFGGWIEKLNEYTNPEKKMPPGAKVVFPRADAVHDNRTQIVMTKSVPGGVNEKS